MLINNSEYLDIVETIKLEIKSAQYKAAVSVNRELIMLYYNIGKIKWNFTKFLIDRKTHRLFSPKRKTLKRHFGHLRAVLMVMQSSQLPALKKQLKQNKKEIENIMKAVKAGLVTKSTKAELERLEEQERIEVEIAKEQIVRPFIPREHIEAWIMNFAKTDLKSQEQKQRLIDIFVNSVHIYDDKIVVLFNYKDGEKCIHIDDIKMNTKKENTQKSECSTLFKLGEASALISELFSAFIISSFVGISTGSSLYVRLKTILSL